MEKLKLNFKEIRSSLRPTRCACQSRIAFNCELRITLRNNMKFYLRVYKRTETISKCLSHLLYFKPRRFEGALKVRFKFLSRTQQVSQLLCAILS